MALYRNHLPQSPETPFITDGGLETTLIYHQGQKLPLFAAFHLLRDSDGHKALRDYFDRYAAIARRHGVGLILDTPTWRASRDWGDQLGYDRHALAAANRAAVELLEAVRATWADVHCPMVISGALGPRGDGYIADHRMSADEAQAYHTEQIETFAGTEADLVTAFTLNYVDEAIGIARAARDAAMPVAISFTVETDGRLPSGETLQEAIERTDAASASYPVYYMINCAHPDHFAETVSQPGAWRDRLRGIRANASRKSHAELDASTELDDGSPVELAQSYVDLRAWVPSLAVIGGCCGTDHRHIEAMCRAVLVDRPTAGAIA